MRPVAALPMYDWPECRAETDAIWGRIRDKLRASGQQAPEKLARRNADLPPVPGGIRDDKDRLIAPDPASLPPDEFDLNVLWRHPALVFAQACWGPLENGLDEHVEVICQPDYSDVEGGEDIYYRSAIIMRADEAGETLIEHWPVLPIGLMAGRRFAFNAPDSMSGILALRRDMAAIGAIAGADSFGKFWSAEVETGGHRASIIAVAEGDADVAAIDCRTWALALRYEPAASELVVAGWTAPRPGLPYVRAKRPQG